MVLLDGEIVDHDVLEGKDFFIMSVTLLYSISLVSDAECSIVARPPSLPRR